MTCFYAWSLFSYPDGFKTKMKPHHVRILKLGFWLFCLLFGLLLIVAPLLTGLLAKTEQMPFSFAEYLSYVDTAQAFMMRAFGFVWVFFFGSCFASFLNVVAWRVPRSRGINGSSMCPYCHTKLGFLDNIPIAGWIRIGGKCRTCKLPVSPRYLIVELLLGTIFVSFYVVQILLGGINLPIREIDNLIGFEHLVFSPNWNLIQLTVYHLILICLLFTFTLIKSERLKIPISIFFVGLLLGIGLPLIWPSMLLVSWQIGVNQLFSLDRLSTNQLLTIAMGVLGGAGCGLLLSFGQSPTDTPEHQSPTITQSSHIPDLIAGMILVGLFLGWQSAISVTTLFLVILLTARIIGLRDNQLNLSTQLLLVTLVHLMLWRITTWCQFWPSPTTGGTFFAVWALVLLLAAGASRLVWRPT